MTEELKPCPFCGGKAEISYFDSSCQCYDVECNDCGACLMGFEEREEAIETWNKRVKSAM